MDVVQAAAAAASVAASEPELTKAAFIIGHGHYALSGMTLVLLTAVLGILFFAYRVQKNSPLDFADMITKDGNSVSLTKVLQLIGGFTATWVIVELTLQEHLSEALFGLYLTYVGAIEGYSKYIVAKYGYSETGVTQAAAAVTPPPPAPAPAPDDPPGPPPPPIPPAPPAPRPPPPTPDDVSDDPLGSTGTASTATIKPS